MRGADVGVGIGDGEAVGEIDKSIVGAGADVGDATMVGWGVGSCLTGARASKIAHNLFDDSVSVSLPLQRTLIHCWRLVSFKVQSLNAVSKSAPA